MKRANPARHVFASTTRNLSDQDEQILFPNDICLALPIGRNRRGSPFYGDFSQRFPRRFVCITFLRTIYFDRTIRPRDFCVHTREIKFVLQIGTERRRIRSPACLTPTDGDLMKYFYLPRKTTDSVLCVTCVLQGISN